VDEHPAGNIIAALLQCNITVSNESMGADLIYSDKCSDSLNNWSWNCSVRTSIRASKTYMYWIFVFVRCD
jgi:hypothetical protein